MIKRPRRVKAYVNPFGTISLHIRQPWVVAFWSITFPGFGYLLLHKFTRGYLLILWEILINSTSKVNLALFYTFTGRPEKAKDVIELRWYLLYEAVYIFSIWDSYRTTVEINKLSLLADHEAAPFSAFKMNVLDIQFLDKRRPWHAAVWSCFMPGLGQILIGRIPMAFFILIWWIAISYNSHLIESIHYMFLGDFRRSTAILNPQWALFMPSLYCFSVYDAYVNTVEFNKLFKLEQSRFLKAEYQQIKLQTILKKV
jgi:hypothetical protein